MTAPISRTNGQPTKKSVPIVRLKLRVLIADDEPLARERLRQFLRTESDIELVGECINGADTVKSIRKASPDLVFLDVRMPELDGFEVIQHLEANKLPAIIFVTAHDKYALRAIEAHAVDYLLKPFSHERFQNALRRVRHNVVREQTHETVKNICELLAGLQTNRPAIEHLTVKSAGRVLFVKTSQIDWIRGADNYVELHVGKSVHLLRQTLAALENRLSAEQFIRIGRSLMVNLDRIKELRTKSHGDYLIVLQDGTRLTGSRTYREGLQRLLKEPL